MKFINKLKEKIFSSKKFDEIKTFDLVRNNERQKHIHPDIIDLLWFKNGPKANFHSQKKHIESVQYGDVIFRFSMFGTEEPSLIDTTLRLGKVSTNESVERPPYFPTYDVLTPKQRTVYWNLLCNPYNTDVDIGFVFILYYGLERHLFDGNFENAFKTILKLRDVHTNKSFQHYSAKALILSCLYHQRPDMVVEFIQSLDKSHEFEMPSDLLLLCYHSFNIHLKPNDIMRMSKDFEFTKQNYIKNYPDIFCKVLVKKMKEKFGNEYIVINEIIKDTDLRKAKSQEHIIFANHSIEDDKIKVPSVLTVFKFKKEVYDLLDNTHNTVKAELATMRKNGSLNKVEKKPAPSKSIVFDEKQEKILLKELKDSKNDLVQRHFTYIHLQNFYYKYRTLDSKYVGKCKEYCMLDIDLLNEMQTYYVRTEIKRIKELTFYSKNEIQREVSKIKDEGFIGNIPAFKRLAIILEKEKDYVGAIEICRRAINYGQESDDTKDGFKGRIVKLENKLQK